VIAAVPDLDLIDQCLARALDLQPAEVMPELSAETSPAWDSAAHLRVIFAVEERFAVTFTLPEIEAATSRAALIALLETKLAAEAQS
jgi:acyl carrier protein